MHVCDVMLEMPHERQRVTEGADVDGGEADADVADGADGAVLGVVDVDVDADVDVDEDVELDVDVDVDVDGDVDADVHTDVSAAVMGADSFGSVCSPARI